MYFKQIFHTKSFESGFELMQSGAAAILDAILDLSTLGTFDFLGLLVC